jgi:hypothetical protein
MKVIVEQKSPPAFNPVTLTITLDSAAEVQALYDLGNYSLQAARAVDAASTELVDQQQMHRVLFAFYEELGNVFGRIGHDKHRIA